LAIVAFVAASGVSAQTYTISTFAGGGLPLNVPISGPPPTAVALDATGNAYFTDQNSILRWDAITGVVAHVAGNGTSGFSGDDGLATNAQLSNPRGLAFDSAGNLYIADSGRVRRVANDVITTVAGGGASSGDGGSATSARLGRNRENSKHRRQARSLDPAHAGWPRDPAPACIGAPDGDGMLRSRAGAALNSVLRHSRKAAAL
jgi:hypothetical protein